MFQADLKVLLAKPTCFLVLGKPGSGKTSVARKLANFWRCQLITPTDCLEQAIQQNSTLGVKVCLLEPFKAVLLSFGMKVVFLVSIFCYCRVRLLFCEIVFLRKVLELFQAQQILQRGEVVNDELVIQIIEERLKSPECEHYGLWL